TIQPGRFHADAHALSFMGEIPLQFPMPRVGVGKRATGFGFAVAADHHNQFFGADVQATNIGVVHAFLLGLGWFRLPDPASSPVELVYAGCRANDASDSPRPWRRGRGAYLKPRLPMQDRASRLIGLPRNMGALCPMPLYHKSNIQAPEVCFLRPDEISRSLLI